MVGFREDPTRTSARRQVGIRDSRKNVQVLIPEILQVLKGTPCKPSTEEIALGKHANPIALELEVPKDGAQHAAPIRHPPGTGTLLCNLLLKQ